MTLVLPLLIPLLAAGIMLAAWGRARAHPWLNLAASGAQVGAALLVLATVADGRILTLQLGSWPAPYGISLVADRLTGLMLAAFAIAAFLGSLHLVVDDEDVPARLGFYALYQTTVLGVSGAVLTGDLFNLFVWFEVVLISSFVILGLGRGRAAREGTIKYFVLNLASSAVFLASIGLLYGSLGTLNYAEISRRLADAGGDPLHQAIGLLLLTVFGIKAAVFPLFSWLPASYPTLPAAVVAVFSALLTKLGIYAMIRLTTLLFAAQPQALQTALVLFGSITMITGVLGALAQSDAKRLLSFHIVSQVGYIVVGVGLASPLALAGAMLHLLHNVLAKSGLLLLTRQFELRGGSSDLGRLGGLLVSAPALAAVFLVLALGLAGVPPLSGFVSKYVLVLSAVERDSWWVAAAMLGVSVLTLMSMLKIWNEAFAKAPPVPPPPARPWHPVRLAPATALALLVVLMGVFGQPIVALTRAGAEQLLRPEVYRAAVLGESF